MHPPGQATVSRAGSPCVQGRHKCIEWLLLQLADCVATIDLQGSTLRALRLRRHGSERSCICVLRAAPCGSTVTDGTVTLPPSAVLLLTGSGAHFADVTFSGTPPPQVAASAMLQGDMPPRRLCGCLWPTSGLLKQTVMNESRETSVGIGVASDVAHHRP